MNAAVGACDVKSVNYVIATGRKTAICLCYSYTLTVILHSNICRSCVGQLGVSVICSDIFAVVYD